jgi:DNA-binding transcriptional LysR family regulator
MTLDQPSPPFHWTLQTGRPDELWRKILDGTLDCAIVLDTSSYAGLDGQMLWQGRFELVATEELPPCPVWISTGQLDTLALNMHFQTKWQRPLAIAGELPSWEVIRAMAHRAKQVGWIPDYLLWGEKGLRVLNWQLAEVPYVAMLIAKPEFLRLPIASCMLDWLGTLLPNFHEPKHG